MPYIHENRYHVTVFDRDKDRGSIIGVELRFGFMEEPNVERYLENMARHKEIDLPTDPAQWIVHVSHENLLPAGRMGLFKRLRFRLFLFLRLVSRARLLRLSSWRRGAAFRRDHAGAGALNEQAMDNPHDQRPMPLIARQRGALPSRLKRSPASSVIEKIQKATPMRIPRFHTERHFFFTLPKTSSKRRGQCLHRNYFQACTARGIIHDPARDNRQFWANYNLGGSRACWPDSFV